MKPTELPHVETVNIRPGVSILSALQHLNYKPWYALAEFVDNSLQSFIANRNELTDLDGDNLQLRVEIELDPFTKRRMVIRDNAAGIAAKDYGRAFRPAELPPDRTGLSEFGMGMKSAACWFASKWSVRTSALGEPVERTVESDIARVVNEDIQELSVKEIQADPNTHFTEIILHNLHKPPQTRTLGKIKEHLASIYRWFLIDGMLDLRFDGVPLEFVSPEVLVAPRAGSQGDPMEWCKRVSIELDECHRVHGFAALRKEGSTKDAGFALFRRNRVIQGSADETYRPETVFGRSNSYTYQRLFGELHLVGFEVSHTKDGFQWEEYEEEVLRQLKDELDSEPLPLLKQAEDYRAKLKSVDITPVAQQAVDQTATIVSRRVAPVVKDELAQTPLEFHLPAIDEPPVPPIASREITLDLDSQAWTISIELSNEPGVGDWLTIQSDSLELDSGENTNAIRRVVMRLAMSHPFMLRFAGATGEHVEPILRLAVAIAIGELIARESGAKYSGRVRAGVNRLLRESLAEAI
jgi:hypothetical protein